jgi:hypothetical protein
VSLTARAAGAEPGDEAELAPVTVTVASVAPAMTRAAPAARTRRARGPPANLYRPIQATFIATPSSNP